MKKYLLSALLLCAVALQTQAQTVIVSQDFSGSNIGGWTSVDNNTNVAKWVKATNPLSTTNYGDLAFASPTAGNGYAAIVSDGVPNKVNTDLISPVFDFSAYDHVGIQFREWIAFRNAADLPVAQILATNDGINWEVVYDVFDGNVTTNGINGELMEADISSVAANQSSVRIKFNYQVNTENPQNKSDIMWLVDDIKITSLPTEDAAVASVETEDFSPVTNRYVVKCTLKNMGVNTLFAATVNYSIDGGPVVSAVVNTALSTFQTQEYTFSTTATVADAGTHTVRVYSTLPNNATDEYLPNDTASKNVRFMDHLPAKNVLIEEFSTAPCGWCPGGATYLKDALETEGAYTVAVAHHAGYQTDVMTIDEHSTLSATFGSGAPQASIDRVLHGSEINIGVPGLDYRFDGGNWWKDAIIARKDFTSPLAIQANNIYTTSSRELIVNINATFYAEMEGDMRVNCYIVEDDITGNQSYNQLSYYYLSPANTNINPWYQVGTQLSGGTAWIPNYEHNKVSRRFLGGAWGSTGVIPAKTDVGATYSKTYTTTIPVSWNASNLSLVAFVHNYNSNFSAGNNEVINVIRMPLNGYAENAAEEIVVSGIEEAMQNGSTMAISPNPATDHIFVSYSMEKDAKVGFEVYNMMGQKVAIVEEAKIAAGSYNTIVNTEKLVSGVYFLTMKNNNTFVNSKKFVVSK